MNMFTDNCCHKVTLLAILAARAIAVPLSPAFPALELQYILDHSQSSLLLSSAKFTSKAKEVLATHLAAKPTHLELPKHQGGSIFDAVELEGKDPGSAGMMLYTSGTTNRPVCCLTRGRQRLSIGIVLMC